ncbi:hypothetical protein GCM10027614_27180 [Micromonospora vulcania]
MVDALRPLVGLPGTPLPAEEAESAWRRFLLALATRRPTVLVFEDLHWADDAMLHFVELLGASAHEVPLLLLCTARPELVDRDPSWAGTITGSVTITLPPLRDTGIAALYAHMFGQAAFSADMLSPLIEVAGGNPLYAHEYVRMLIEQGALRRSGRGWSLDKQLDLTIPENVHSVIANRVDLLDVKDRAVLLAASVVGVQFWPGAVAAALGQPVESVERSLRRLEQRDFVHEQAASTMAGQAEFRFRHVLVRDVCYQRLPRTERVARHERARTGSTRCRRAATPTWPRCWPTTAGRPTRSPARWAWRSDGTPGPHDRPCTGRPGGRTRCTGWTRRPATPAGR